MDKPGQYLPLLNGIPDDSNILNFQISRKLEPYSEKDNWVHIAHRAIVRKYELSAALS